MRWHGSSGCGCGWGQQLRLESAPFATVTTMGKRHDQVSLGRRFPEVLVDRTIARLAAADSKVAREAMIALIRGDRGSVPLLQAVLARKPVGSADDDPSLPVDSV